MSEEKRRKTDEELEKEEETLLAKLEEQAKRISQKKKEIAENRKERAQKKELALKLSFFEMVQQETDCKIKSQEDVESLRDYFKKYGYAIKNILEGNNKV